MNEYDVLFRLYGLSTGRYRGVLVFGCKAENVGKAWLWALNKAEELEGPDGGCYFEYQLVNVAASGEFDALVEKSGVGVYQRDGDD